MLEIRVFPDPVLRQKAAPIELIDEDFRSFAEDMVEAMYQYDGVGLAAPQVGVSRRVIVIDVDGERNNPRVLVNPIITKKSKEKSTAEEGCLSLPGLNAKVTRSAEVTVEAQDETGAVVELSGGGLLARALQHEIDHLDGILFIDKVAPAAKFSLRGELERLKESYESLHSEQKT